MRKEAEEAAAAMVVTPSSSSSSTCSSSFGSFDEVVKPSSATPAVSAATVKFLCSYGGRILPRYPDGKLRYLGGDTRVISLDRPVRFSEIQEKMREMCGWPGAVGIRCQLPTEDLDALVSVKSDEDLANVVAEYDRLGRHKVRAFLFPSVAKPAGKTGGGESSTHRISSADRCVRQICTPSRLPVRVDKAVASAAPGDLRHHGHHQYHHHHLHGHAAATRPCNYLVHHGSHWQQ